MIGRIGNRLENLNLLGEDVKRLFQNDRLV